MKKLLAFVLFGVVLGTLSGLTAFGQAISVNGGAIQGTITDTTGAAVSGATIKIENPATNFNKVLTSDSSGFYSFGPLVPGNYKVVISASGFSSLTVDTVIRTGTATSGNFKLQVGSETTTIEVAAGALQVNTEQAGVSDVLTQEQISKLPVNGRNFLDLAQIEPGVILQSGESFDPTKAGYSALSVSGVSGRTTRILLDGQDITDETVGTTIFNVSQGAIDEFQLNRSNQDASGEVTSTGQVLVSTRSGTNAFHGQLFGNFQDHRAGFARLKSFDVPFQRNQFGGSVGGPILPNKLFFFVNAERIKQDSSAVSPVGPTFASILAAHPTIPSPYRETYSTARLDWNGPLHGHYFARINYNVNSVASNYGRGYWLYANRDNSPGGAFGADFSAGHFTHSFRGSYEKFHNLISDQTSGNSSIYNGIPGFAFYLTAQRLYSGPNYLAPQGTFQSDKQARYDGSWTRGNHNIRFGASVNRLLGGGFASFFGLSPRASIGGSGLFTGPTSTNPNALGCKGVAGAAACPGDPLNGYHISSMYVGNGQGAFTENPGFGMPNGGVFSWRYAAYIQDSWKIAPSFTLSAGLRWAVDTRRANQDIATPSCADVNPDLGFSCTGNLLDQWQPGLGKVVRQPYGNVAPQLGFVFSPGDHKWAIRAGAGIFFESNVFNNQTNSRTGLIKAGLFNDEKLLCGGTYSMAFPDGTTVSSVNGTSIQTLCNSTPLGTSAASFIQLQNAYQANTSKTGPLSNGAFVGNNLYANNIYAPGFKQPYSEQWSGGIQRELWKGTVLSADYVHNSTIKVMQKVDVNHVGAARFLNATAARNAIAATTADAGCAGGASAAAINCAIANGYTISDFAGFGLDSANNVYGGPSALANGDTPDHGAAFAGQNPLLGTGAFLFPVGRSGYDALQIVFRQQKRNPLPGITNSNFQISYNLSKVVTSAGGDSDQFFVGASSAPWNNDSPTATMGRASLDRTHQLSFGGAINLKYGPQIGMIGHFTSAAPTSMILDATNPSGDVFQSDLNGDGTTGDLLPFTEPGDYMHRYKGQTLNNAITRFNSEYAGKLTPAGQALVSAGLMTSSQLAQLQGVVQPIAAAPSNGGINNSTFRSLDMNFSYPIRFPWLGESFSLEPAVAMYNVFNFSNFNNPTGTLINTAHADSSAGYINGANTYDQHETNRVQRGSGTFSQGAPRATEFQLKLNF